MNNRRKEEQRRVLLQRNFPFLWGRFKVTIVHTHGDKILPCGTEDIYSCFFSLHSHNRHHSFQQGFSTSALLTFELDNSSLEGASLGIHEVLQHPWPLATKCQEPSALAVTTQHTCRYCQVSRGGKEGNCSPQVRTTSLERRHISPLWSLRILSSF